MSTKVEKDRIELLQGTLDLLILRTLLLGPAHGHAIAKAIEFKSDDVLQVEVDGRGNVRNLNWLRAPRHAPEVIAEIEKTVRDAAPFPVPARMGKVVYTDTWLWHKSGRFQLDTLTEGQD